MQLSYRSRRLYPFIDAILLELYLPRASCLVDQILRVTFHLLDDGRFCYRALPYFSLFVSYLWFFLYFLLVVAFFTVSNYRRCV